MLLGAWFILTRPGWPQKWEACALDFAEEPAPGPGTLLDRNQGM